ncbi:MAG TPA: sensor histidine kinase [Puia sp.]|jgi:signal transduction histidine kinase|nr:sensor histidine kinase [Puia sp.]
MQNQNSEIYFVILMGILLALLVVGFILVMAFMYQRKRVKQERELAILKERYEQEMLRSQLEIQEHTMKNIAQELHDNIGQTLSVIKLWMSIVPIEKSHPASEGIENSKEMLHKVIREMADLTKSLHTDRISDIGLKEAIGFDIASLKRTGLLKIDYEVVGEEFHFPEEKSIFLFRMYQEMMNNILKHSKASEVNISIVYSDDYTFVLTIQDNGVGFNTQQKKESVAGSSGLGLKSMRNRASLIGANLSILSEPGNGTTISVELALNQPA